MGRPERTMQSLTLRFLQKCYHVTNRPAIGAPPGRRYGLIIQTSSILWPLGPSIGQRKPTRVCASAYSTGLWAA